MGAQGDFEGMTGKVITTKLRTARSCAAVARVNLKLTAHKNVHVVQIELLSQLLILKPIGTHDTMVLKTARLVVYLIIFTEERKY